MNANSHYRQKYGATPTTVDNVRFASKAEASRYGELKMLQKAGLIRGLELQPEYPLYARGRDGIFVPVGKYVADFSYEEFEAGAWITVIEDVKGMKTPMYRWKKKHFEIEYAPMKVTEIL